MCCKYIALPLDPPETKRDFDDMRWYLLHQGISVFVEDDEWYIQIEARCNALRPDNLCGIYETRPEICREYTTEGCDYHGGNYEYKHIFKTPEEIAVFGKEYLAEEAAKKRKTAARKRKAKIASEAVRKRVTYKNRLQTVK
jgi:Fe-S-cluster containining protein